MILSYFEKNQQLSLFVLILTFASIFVISSIEFPSGTGIGFSSWIYHSSIFFILALLLSITLTKGKRKRIYLIFIAVLIAIGYGITDELHQFFVPNRYCDIKDVLVNSIGILSAGIFYGFRLKNKVK